MTKDELRKGLRETFSLPNERNLFWKYIGQLEQRIAELEEPILCNKCNDHIDDDGAICGVCASTQDTVINEQRERIAELEKENEVSSEDGDDGEFRCDLCGAKLLPCDESPLYGKSWLHPESCCVKAGLWWGCEKS